MANWRGLEAAVDGVVGAAFGETVRLSPMKDGRSDPDRPQVTITGLLHVEADDSFSVSSSDRGLYKSRVNMGKTRLDIDRSRYAGPIIRVGDKVKAMDRAGQPLFSVEAVGDRHSNLLVLTLGEL